MSREYIKLNSTGIERYFDRLTNIDLWTLMLMIDMRKIFEIVRYGLLDDKYLRSNEDEKNLIENDVRVQLISILKEKINDGEECVELAIFDDIKFIDTHNIELEKDFDFETMSNQIYDNDECEELFNLMEYDRKYDRPYHISVLSILNLSGINNPYNIFELKYRNDIKHLDNKTCLYDIGKLLSEMFQEEPVISDLHEKLEELVRLYPDIIVYLVNFDFKYENGHSNRDCHYAFMDMIERFLFKLPSKYKGFVKWKEEKRREFIRNTIMSIYNLESFFRLLRSCGMFIPVTMKEDTLKKRYSSELKKMDNDYKEFFTIVINMFRYKYTPQKDASTEYRKWLDNKFDIHNW